MNCSAANQLFAFNEETKKKIQLSMQSSEIES